MIANYKKSSEWLPFIFNPSFVPSEKDIESIKKAGYSACSGYVGEKDMVKYGPFFETIYNDILEFTKFEEYGYRTKLEWPYNEEMEKHYKELGVYGTNPRLYNNLDKARYSYYPETSNINVIMDTFGTYDQVYYDECSIRCYHFMENHGGVCVIINRENNEIKIFGIGEDDGRMFPKTVKDHINQYELWKLTSIVNDIHIEGFENQEVIEKLYEKEKL